ncbi:MAG: rhomboid family intramembrane serine protease [Clostridiales bacterium]|nr:rhomboid family intramembrane serine protease [Clostridiales bacterium]
MKLLNQLERRLYKFRIQPFFSYIVFAMAGIYLIDLFFPQFFLISRMALITSEVYAGQIWRLVSFLIIPPGGSILQTALTLYFYYFVGTALENRWGPRRFLLYYVIGVIAAIISALLTGIGTNLYLNLSLFFAFAILFPDFQLLLFFVIPLKVKWLAVLNAVYYLYGFVYGDWAIRIAILFSLANLLLFFGGDLYNKARMGISQWKRRQAFKNRSR